MPKPNFELVIFDMAGTTVRDDDAVNVCLREALAPRLAVSRDAVNAVMGLPKPTAIRLLLEGHANGGRPVSEELIDTLYRDFLDRMIRHYRTAPSIEPMPHALETFRRLKDAGVRVALDSGFSRAIVDAVLQRLGWTNGLLDATVASDEVPQGRPYADLAFKAMELTGVRDAKKVAKVGDTPSDLEEGTAAGCGLVIGVTNGTHTREQLSAHPHTHLLPSLCDVPGLILGN